MGDSSEVQVTRLTEQMLSLQREMSSMAVMMQRLADSVEALTKENMRIATAEVQVAALLRGQESLWEEIRNINDRQQQLGSKAAGGMWDVLKLCGAAVVGVVAAKYGSK
ncbi:hypothetical protein [Paludibacterium denitrificans]|uniref:Uncharacterized protein n=1 Tax=Paludibacterium denitrificans TaxID=2675226 RepID=A0A844GBN0_9NEIS|nr:hypothetical protein [Paludibacterium denitrificans]MTD32648.1 hypothetical protein [Paludibacterium denitrificans]